MPSTSSTGSPPPTAVDLFAGAGGLSTGLRAAGFEVLAAVEIDPTAASTFKRNHQRTSVLVEDIRSVSGSRLLQHIGLRRGQLDLLTGCPPCQGFSSLRTKRRMPTADDPRNNLALEVLRLVRSMRPRAVLLENVPGLASDFRFAAMCNGLRRSGYDLDYTILNTEDFGVPQRRHRLVLLATRDLAIPPNWSQPNARRRTVRDAIGGLPIPGNSGDPLHDVAEERSERIMKRIRAVPRDGGGQRDLPTELRLDCHKKSSGYSDVYGRMTWQDVAPTITSGCHNPSRGRFLHPVEDRAITLREAALLQCFPRNYNFDLSRGKEHCAGQIGNAFPPPVIRAIGRKLVKALQP